ncbi:hypothetical protein BDF14DRAFT_1942369 [Spinellus fusiger]|nr:hypothetical protein BDF14DRAFT_1942369 [Spinellus fusiger]
MDAKRQSTRSVSRRSSKRYSRSRSASRKRPATSNTSKECRVYVGNLSYDTKWHHLKDFMREGKNHPKDKEERRRLTPLFSYTAGTVVHADIMTSASGRSKGCGVVEYKRPEDAQNAIRMMHKSEFMGRPVFVREDLKGEASTATREVPEECHLFVGNLPFFASWQDLKDLFRKAGRVRHTDIITDPETRRSTGAGIVIFDDARDARTAIEMYSGYDWQGRRLEVCEERNRPPPATSETRDHGRDPSSCRTWLIQANYINNINTLQKLPYSTTWQDLIDLFRHVGPVVRAEIIVVGGQPKGSGLVRFEDFPACERAIDKFHGYLYGGRYLDIRLDKFSTAA